MKTIKFAISAQERNPHFYPSLRENSRFTRRFQDTPLKVKLGVFLRVLPSGLNLLRVHSLAGMKK
jgi:hypothetical protein